MIIGEAVSDDFGIPDIFNEFFVNIAPNLNISPEKNFETDAGELNEPVLKATRKPMACWLVLCNSQ